MVTVRRGPKRGETSVIPIFVIFLREGIEASMIVAILLAYLDRSGQRQHFRDVFAGIGAAAVLIVAGGVAAFLFINHYSGSRVQKIFEVITYLIAAAALTYMTFWMNAHARTLTADLQRRSQAALSKGSRAGMGVLAFTAVGREGLETMVFTLAIIFARPSQAPVTVGDTTKLIIGAALGLTVAMIIAFVIYKLGRRLNLRIFFRVLGLALMVFAAGLLADAVQNLQQLGWLPFGRAWMWDTHTMMSESSSVGDLFHSLLGYAERPTVLQAVVWTGYLVVVVFAFARFGRGRRKHQRSASPSGPVHDGAGEVTTGEG